MADDWEDDDWESAPTPALSKPPTEAPNDWEDEDAEPEQAPVQVAAAPKAPAPMKQSKRIALALKKKEEAEREEAIQRLQAREKRLAEMDAASRKLEMQKLVEEADLDNARNLFMDNGSRSSLSKDHIPPDLENLHTMNPSTDEELTRYAKMLTEKCQKFNKDPRRTARYMVFVKDVFRGLSADLGPDDVKELATHMNTISNVRRDEYKKSKGQKKKPPKKTTAVRVDVDDLADTTYADEYDDFM